MISLHKRRTNETVRPPTMNRNHLTNQARKIIRTRRVRAELVVALKSRAVTMT